MELQFMAPEWMNLSERVRSYTNRLNAEPFQPPGHPRTFGPGELLCRAIDCAMDSPAGWAGRIELVEVSPAEPEGLGPRPRRADFKALFDGLVIAAETQRPT